MAFKNSSRATRACALVTGIGLAFAGLPAAVASPLKDSSSLGSLGSLGSLEGSLPGSSLPGSSLPQHPKGATFQRTATFPVYENRPEGDPLEQETVAEISTVTDDGKTLIYTDAASQRIGFLDISEPEAPAGLGTVSLKALGNEKDEPTSVAAYGDYLFVVVDESAGDFANPSGRVDVLRISDRKVVHSIDLGGQPDSIAISPDGTRAAIAMENQRDEDQGDGGLPQSPTGFVQTLDLSGEPSEWKATPIRFENSEGELLGVVAEAGLDTPEDMEPEYVTINGRNELAVSLQENNGVAIIDLNTKKITRVFSAGTVDLEGVDAKKDGLINPTDSLHSVVREPDAIAWVDDDHLATANEGDWKGGSRGWTVFTKDGEVSWDAGNTIEELANRHGLHNEKRAEKKGPEIEGLATTTMNGVRYAFVASERSNFVAVYNVNDPKNPEFVQTLFSTNGPEGILPIPGRNMLAVSSEEDDSEAGVRSAVNLYRLDGESTQPSIVGGNADGHAIGFSALSGLTSDPKDPQRLFAVSDSALDQGFVYTVDASATPAVITERRAVTKDGAPAEDLDLEGVAAAEDGGFWLTSEGKEGADNRLLRADANLAIQQSIELPADVASNMGKYGLEGVDSALDDKGVEQVFVALQRPLEGEHSARIGKYNTETKEWSWFGYSLDEAASEDAWTGLSEITAVNDHELLVVERDNQNGPSAAIKRVMRVTLPYNPEGEKSSAGDGVQPVKKELAVDVLPHLQATKGWTQEKLEGFTVAADGEAYAVTDNDALDDATGETVFLRLGKLD